MSARGEKLKKMSKTQLLDEVMRLEVILEQQMKAAPGTSPDVEVQGIVASVDKQPYVQMRAGEAAWQMSPAKARQHALIVLDAAVEAERDAATIAFCEQTMDMSEVAAGGFLHEMRNHRKDWFAEFREMRDVSPP